MKPRIEKKLSKKLAVLLKNERGYAGRIWLDDGYCRSTIYGHEKPLTPRQRRYNLESKTSIKSVPSIGGESDYFGEGTDHSTLWKYFRGGAYDEAYYAGVDWGLEFHRYRENDPVQEAWQRARHKRSRRLCTTIRLMRNLRVTAVSESRAGPTNSGRCCAT
jgi:hypothetical protein